MNSHIKLVAIDLDGTLVKGQSQRGFLIYLKKHKLIKNGKYTILLFWFLLYKLGFVKGTKRALVFALSCFKGLNISRIDNLASQFVEDDLVYYKHSKELISCIINSGIDVLLLSNAVDPVVKAVAKSLQINNYLGTKLSTINNVFDGKIIGDQNYGFRKIENLLAYSKALGLQPDDILVIADHNSDQELLKFAGSAFVANPNLKMKHWAEQNCIPVVYLDKHESFQYLKSYIVLK